MQGPRLVVVSDARPIRETLALLLRDKYEVATLSVPQADADLSPLSDASLVIADRSAVRASATLQRCSATSALPLLEIDDYAPDGSLPFAAPTLLRQIAAAVAPHARGAVRDAGASMAYPFVPAAVEARTRRAIHHPVPVLITGEPGVGKSRLGRSLHGHANGSFLMVPPESFDQRGLRHLLGSASRASVTLYVPELAAVSPEGRIVLRELVDTGALALASTSVSTRIIAASAEPYEHLESLFQTDSDLFHHLSVIHLHLPALRERTADLPAMVEQLCARITGKGTQVRLTPAAIDRLQNYLWFGNLAELEAVVTRTLILSDRSTIDADDLIFRDRPGATPTPVPSRASPAPGKDDDAPLVLDLMLTELAHELKNPMVVIKTAAQHMQRAHGDEGARKEMARLTGEAVDRMDRVLENLLEYTRFAEPAPQDILLNDLLTRCLSDVNSEFGDRKVVLDYHAPARQVVHVDVLQLAYALENLLRMVLRDLVPGTTLAIRPMLAHSGFRMEFNAGAHPISKQLAAAVSEEAAAQAAQPLGFRLANALIQRNHGAIRSGVEGENAIVAVELPEGGDGVEGNEEATRLDS